MEKKYQESYLAYSKEFQNEVTKRIEIKQVIYSSRMTMAALVIAAISLIIQIIKG